ncbi:MAG: SGNH/GDSL hydrolase family protein [Paludibacter sp.]|nr:SGNH/GDSL hydrolase family protein [Paludibacter sp.]
MKKISILTAFILATINLIVAQTWDILDKSMAVYNQNGGADTNQAWAVAQGSSAGSSITQQSGYVNFTKTNAGSTARWAWVRPATALADLTDDTPYSIEVKVRVHSTGIADNATNYEANQVSLRLGGKNTAARFYLQYGDGVTSGSISTTSGGSDAYRVNTSAWQVYRMVFHADHKKYDVYLVGVEDPIFEDVSISATSDQNGVYFGAESYHRCNMDVEYVKMGSGDFFSKPKIVSVLLNADSQLEDRETTISVKAYTTAINNNEKLLISLVDAANNTVTGAVEALIANGKATANLTVPATVPRGRYSVQVAAPGGTIGDVSIAPVRVPYLIASSVFEGKNMVAFGNSITIAANSWAYHTSRKLGLAALYNGAVSGSIWSKRERTIDGKIIQTQDYDDPAFAGISSSSTANPDANELQKRINNCAIVHIQKYLRERTVSPDLIILSYGTNDSYNASDLGDADEALKATDLNLLNVYTMAGAVRWSLETLKTRFQDAKLYVSLPLQAASDSKNEGNVSKIAIIKKICDGLSVPYFDCYTECGITQANQAFYLRDGLHPNEAGQILHGDYIIMKLEDANDGISAVEQPGLPDPSVTVSANVMNGGGQLTVQSSGVSLTGVNLYGLTGNKICGAYVSGSEYTLRAPATAGMYLLTALLSDRTAKKFKIIVK